MFTASRLSDNLIGGYYDDDAGKYVATTEGIIALCEGLKGSSVTSLECAANPTSVREFAFVSAPVDTPTVSPFPPMPPLACCSLSCNNIGDEGASAIAANLRETMISNLECAATR